MSIAKEHLDEVSRADLHELARGDCRCDGSRCARHLAEDRLREHRPKIVVLCGSARFFETFERTRFAESLLGHVVLSIEFYPGAAHRAGTGWDEVAKAHGRDVGLDEEEKIALDVLHKRKIDLADEVIVINVDGYVGKSTADDVVEECVAAQWPELAESPIQGLWFTGSSVWGILYPPVVGLIRATTEQPRDWDLFVLDELGAQQTVTRMGWTRFPACPTHAKRDQATDKTISERNVPRARSGSDGTPYGDGVSYETDRGVVDLWISTAGSALEEIRAYPEGSHDHCRAAFSFSDGLIVLPNEVSRSRRIKSERHPFDPT